MTEEDEEVISELEEDTISFTKEECIALLNECKYSYISYQNPLARAMIRRMSDFIGWNEIIGR